MSLAGLQDKIDIKRLIVFTYNSNEQLKNKMRFTVAFKIASNSQSDLEKEEWKWRNQPT